MVVTEQSASGSASASVSVDPPVSVGGAVLRIVGAVLSGSALIVWRQLVSLGSEDGGRIMGIDNDMDIDTDTLM